MALYKLIICVFCFSLFHWEHVESYAFNRIANNEDEQNFNPNLVRNYLSIESINRLEQRYGSAKISRDLTKVKFHLWVPGSNVDSPLVFNHETASEELVKFGFDPKRETKVLTHGFSSAMHFNDKFATEYLNNKECNFNIIGADWSPLATFDNYFIAAENAISVGEYIGNLFISMIVQPMGMDPKMFHFIGHSLGAHAGGHFGRVMANNVGKIGRLTELTNASKRELKEYLQVYDLPLFGLDPAAPYFDLTSNSNRLAKDDAEFVDIIHTNSGSLLQGSLSFMEKMGHVDFYPNGGKNQPGCSELCLGSLCADLDIFDLLQGGCSHQRSGDYYVASIMYAKDANVFVGHECDDWEDYTSNKCINHKTLEMGENVELIPSNVDYGGFYLETLSEPPFTIGE